MTMQLQLGSAKICLLCDHVVKNSKQNAAEDKFLGLTSYNNKFLAAMSFFEAIVAVCFPSVFDAGCQRHVK